MLNSKDQTNDHHFADELKAIWSNARKVADILKAEREEREKKEFLAKVQGCRLEDFVDMSKLKEELCQNAMLFGSLPGQDWDFGVDITNLVFSQHQDFKSLLGSECTDAGNWVHSELERYFPSIKVRLETLIGRNQFYFSLST
jgi:hypothetical protein